MPNARQESSWRKRTQRGELHRRNRGGSRHSGHDAEADREPLGDGERRGGQGRAGGVEAVFDHPEFVRTACLEAARDVRHQGGGKRPGEAHSESSRGPSHIETVKVAGDSRVSARTGPLGG